MAQQVIGIGAVANDNTGDPLRTAFDKANDNFTELYGRSATLEDDTALGSAVALTDGIPVDVASVDLPVGTWEVDGNVTYVPAGGALPTILRSWITTVSATQPTAPNEGAFNQLALAFTSVNQTLPSGRRLVVNAGPGTLTVYLGARASFTGGTLGAAGHLLATRRE